MKKLWQRWSYWYFEQRLVWVFKRIVTLLALSFFSAVVLGLIWGVVILSNFLLGSHPDDLIPWVCGTVMFAANFYMLDGVLWD